MKLGASLLVTIVSVLALGDNALGLCDHRTIEKIVQYWGDNIPQGVLKESVGVYTYVYMSHQFLTQDDKNIYCLATRLAKDKTSAMDIYVFRDKVKRRTVRYNKTENKGKITLKLEGYNNETQLVLSFKNHVLTFWQCVANDLSGKYDSLVGIAVDVNHIFDPETETEIANAKDVLKSLGLDTGDDLNPCTLQMVQNIK